MRGREGGVELDKNGDETESEVLGVPYHNNTVDRGSRVVGGRWTIHNSDFHNRSFVTFWSANGKRKREGFVG
jgi:hypothetical protein